METKGLEIRVQNIPWYGGVQMIFHERGFDNKVVRIGELIMKEYKGVGAVIPPESRVDIENRTAQILIDDLWNSGFRPTEGSGSAGSLKKTENHLKDMRMLVSKIMKVEL